MPFVLTLIAAREVAPLTPGLVAAVRDAIRGGPADTLSEGEAADLPCADAPDLDHVRTALGGAPIDAIALPAEGRRKRLLLADMDSTIVTGETLDELAAFAGVHDRIAAITRRSMNGEIDFSTALRERVALLRGLKRDALERTWEGVRLTAGARTLVATMAAAGARTVLVSGGFSFFTGRVAALAGFDAHHANRLLDDGEALTGEVGEPILDRDAKLRTLREFADRLSLPCAATLAIGDGANCSRRVSAWRNSRKVEVL
jgi:phosphoserine phosphatase